MFVVTNRKVLERKTGFEQMGSSISEKGPAVPPPVLFQQDFKGATGASLRRNIEQVSARYSGVPVTDAATSGQR